MQLRKRRHSNERVVVLGGFGLATAVCLALELLREHHYGTLDFRFLLWNLFLAWIPLLIALAVYDGYRRGAPLAPARARGAPLAALPAERAVHRHRLRPPGAAGPAAVGSTAW